MQHLFSVQSIDKPNSIELQIIADSRGEALRKAYEIIPDERLCVVGREPLPRDITLSVNIKFDAQSLN